LSCDWIEAVHPSSTDTSAFGAALRSGSFCDARMVSIVPGSSAAKIHAESAYISDLGVHAPTCAPDRPSSAPVQTPQYPCERHRAASEIDDLERRLDEPHEARTEGMVMPHRDVVHAHVIQ
jgi:hypothetical protein